MRVFLTIRLFIVAASLVIATGLLTRANAQVPVPSTDTVIFDNLTDPATGNFIPLSGFRFIDETPRTLIGAKVNFGNVPSSALIGAKQMQLGLAHIPATGLATQYNNIQLQMRFYDNGSAAPGTDVFNDPIGGILTFNVFDAIKAASPVQTTNNTLLNQQGYFFRVDLPASVQFKDPLNIGIAFRFLGERTGTTGLVASEDLSLVMRQGAPFNVGTSDFNSPGLGYLRGGSATGNPRITDFNFDQNNGASFAGASNVGVAFQLFGTVIPEAGTANLLLLAILPAGWAIVARRRKA